MQSTTQQKCSLCAHTEKPLVFIVSLIVIDSFCVIACKIIQKQIHTFKYCATLVEKGTR